MKVDIEKTKNGDRSSSILRNSKKNFRIFSKRKVHRACYPLAMKIDMEKKKMKTDLLS